MDSRPVRRGHAPLVVRHLPSALGRGAVGHPWRPVGLSRRVSSTSSATRDRCCSALPSRAASVVARLKYRCAWCSQVKPMPPCTWMVSRRDPAERRRCRRLRDARPPVPDRRSRPVSAHTAWYAAERACSRSTSRSASLCLTAWNDPIGLPNCSRDLRVLDRQIQQMLRRADLFDGQQRRADLQRVLDDALGLVRAGHQSAPVRRTNSTVACGRVRSSVASGLRCTPDAAASTAYSATPSAPLRGDQQIVGRAAVDHPLDGAGERIRRRRGDRDRRRSRRRPPGRRRRTPRCAVPSTRSASSSSRAGPATPRPERGSPGTRCRTAGRMPARAPSSSTATAWSTRVPPTPPSASGTESPSTPSSAPSRAHTFGVERRIGLHQPPDRLLVEVVGAELAHGGAQLALLVGEDELR